MNDLIWGVTIAAAQTEGAYNTDGKGASIWDKFTEKRRKIKDGSNAKVAIDFYHRYKEDIDLAAHIGLKIFRFSVSCLEYYLKELEKSTSKELSFTAKLSIIV